MPIEFQGGLSVIQPSYLELPANIPELTRTIALGDIQTAKEYPYYSHLFIAVGDSQNHQSTREILTQHRPNALGGPVLLGVINKEGLEQLFPDTYSRNPAHTFVTALAKELKEQSGMEQIAKIRSPEKIFTTAIDKLGEINIVVDLSTEQELPQKMIMALVSMANRFSDNREGKMQIGLRMIMELSEGVYQQLKKELSSYAAKELIQSRTFKYPQEDQK